MMPDYLTWPEAVYLIATGDLSGGVITDSTKNR
jgi:hypothetical protein